MFDCYNYRRSEKKKQEGIEMFGLTQAQLIAQILGYMGTIIVVIGMQQKKYKAIVICKIGNEFLAAVHYLLMGGYTGMTLNFVSCITNGVYYRRISKGKSTLIFQIIFGAMFCGLGFLSWHGPISLFVIAAKLLSSVSLGINNPRTIRILNLISNPCWLIYDIAMGSVAGMTTDILVICSVLIAFIRIDILGRKAE